MKIDQTTLIEIEDYINHIDDVIGLKPETVIDVKNAISKYRKKLNSICSEFEPRQDFSSGICKKLWN